MATARDYKTRRPKPGAYNGWLGLGAGLAVGLAVAGVVYLKDHKSDPGIAMATKSVKKRPHGNDPPEAADASVEEPAQSYDFYDRLPKFEVIVPEKDKDVHRDVKSVPETRHGTYIMQAGSYKNFADADRVRAQLALQGVEMRVQKVSLDSDTWYRIRSNPISNLDQLNRMRAILRRGDVDALVIQVGD
jgi:cell division protein FtsN